MKKHMINAVAFTVLLSSSALARDNHQMLPIQAAMDAPAAQGKLDKSIRLFFADQSHPNILQEMGDFSTSKKTNSFGKSASEACNWAFLSAMLTLQERARQEGGNAVINIKSNYKNIETASSTDFMCGDGAFVSGVAFKGKVVKLAE